MNLTESLVIQLVNTNGYLLGLFVMLILLTLNTDWKKVESAS